MNQLAPQIKKLRTGQNLSQDDLAEKLYVSRQSISKYENGEATPDVEKLVQMAEIFEVSLDFLILGKEAEPVNEKKEGRPMNVWEFIANYWWLVFPIAGFIYGLLNVLK